jgi:hypothetical protein
VGWGSSWRWLLWRTSIWTSWPSSGLNTVCGQLPRVEQRDGDDVPADDAIP